MSQEALALSPYGLHRVFGQRGVLPQPAERLDALMACQSNEIQIAVEEIHVDASSFHQLREENADSEPRLRHAIEALVERRGKLHNPVTNSGGVLIGTVQAVGPAHPNPPLIGQRIVSLVSLSLTPLHLNSIDGIDLRSGRLLASGTAYLFACAPWTALPADIPPSIALAALDVAGAPARVKLRTARGARVLVVGGGNSGMLSAVAALDAGAASVVVADIDAARLAWVREAGLPSLSALQADALNAVLFAQKAAPLADLTVCCINRPGAEPGCILATKASGHVLFFSMVTDFARAALCAEGLGSGATLEIGNGFLPGHADYVIDLLRRNQRLAAHLG